MATISITELFDNGTEGKPSVVEFKTEEEMEENRTFIESIYSDHERDGRVTIIKTNVENYPVRTFRLFAQE